jgi:hypothetical protein
MTAWTDTVKKTFKQGRLTNPAYQFKNALKDASKYYKKGEDVAVEAVKKTSKHARKLKKKVTFRIRKTLKGKNKKNNTYKKRKGTRRS